MSLDKPLNSSLEEQRKKVIGFLKESDSVICLNLAEILDSVGWPKKLREAIISKQWWKINEKVNVILHLECANRMIDVEEVSVLDKKIKDLLSSLSPSLDEFILEILGNNDSIRMLHNEILKKFVWNNESSKIFNWLSRKSEFFGNDWKPLILSSDLFTTINKNISKWINDKNLINNILDSIKIVKKLFNKLISSQNYKEALILCSKIIINLENIFNLEQSDYLCTSDKEIEKLMKRISWEMNIWIKNEKALDNIIN